MKRWERGVGNNTAAASTTNGGKKKNSEKVNREEEEKEGEWKGGNDGGSFFVFFLLNGVVLECMYTTRCYAMYNTEATGGRVASRADGWTDKCMDGRTDEGFLTVSRSLFLFFAGWRLNE